MTNWPKPSEGAKRVFMIAGEDGVGDIHTVVTTDVGRAIAHYRRMSETLSDVHGNEGFETLVRPIADAN